MMMSGLLGRVLGYGRKVSVVRYMLASNGSSGVVRVMDRMGRRVLRVLLKPKHGLIE